MRVTLSLSIAVVGLASLSSALSNNFGHPNEGYHGSSHQRQPSFGDVHIPLGESIDDSGNMWSQAAAVDPGMYTRYNQPPPQAGGYPMYHGGYDMTQAQDASFHPSQGYQEPLQAYDLPPTHYDLPPTHYDPDVYSNYDPSAQAYVSIPPASPAISYQSIGQPYRDHSAFAGAEHEEEQSWQGYEGQSASNPAWTATITNNNSTGEMPAPMYQNFDLPEHTQAMDRLSLGGLARIRTGGGSDGDEGSHRGEQRSAGGRGKGVVATRMEAFPVREPLQTARVTSSSRRKEKGKSSSMVKEPTTARLAYLAKQQGRIETRNLVEDQFIARRLSSNMHEQLVAEQVCEIKITHPGQELAIGRVATSIVEEWGDARYTYDYRGWNAVYRHKLSSLRRGFVDNGGGTAEQLEWYLLSNFRNLRVSFQGVLADPVQEQQQLAHAAEVWAHFKRMRLRGVIHDDSEVSIPIVAHLVPRFKCGLTSVTDSLTLIKNYLRSVLGFTYLDIEQLEHLLPRSGSEQAQEE